MKKSLPVLGLAVLMLVAAYALARCGEDRLHEPATPEEQKKQEKAAKRVVFPRERAKLKPKQEATEQKVPVVGRDKLQRALSSPGGDGALVIEVNAIRHAPLVEKLLACEEARRGDGAGGLATLKEELGVDVTEDVDRVAFDKDVLAVSGFFEGLKLPAELGEGEAYGDGGRVFRVKDDAGKAMVVGKVGDELLVTGFDEAQVKGAIDRAEGRGTPGPAFPSGLAGSEVYGLLGPAFLKDLLNESQDPMAKRLGDIVTQSTVQVAVDDAAALSLDLVANSKEEGRDLGKALGGAIAMGRKKALDEGNTELAGLLDQAHVVPRDDGSVAVDVAVDGDTLLAFFGCTPEGKPK